MADERFESGPKPEGAARAAHGSGESSISSDPKLAAYKAFLEQNRDKKTVENSLLISLCVIFVLTFITFPELVMQLAEKKEQEDVIEEVPQQKITEKKEEEQQQPEEKVKVETKEFKYARPSVASPTAGQKITRLVADSEDLNVKDEGTGDLDWDEGDIPDAPFILVAGPIERPVFQARGGKTYPSRARMLKKQGLVRLEVKIDRNGNMIDIKLLEITVGGQKDTELKDEWGFGQEAIKYFKNGKWKPAKQNGKPINAVFRFVFDYKIS